MTVTHADVLRYFMTIPEAAQLVIEADHWPRVVIFLFSIWASL